MASTLRHYSTPGVYRREIDQSNILVPTGTSTGGTVIRAKKGPIARPVLVSNDQEYIDIFGSPVFTSGASSADTLTPELGYGQYAAIQFLQESNSLYVVRDYDAGDTFASVLYSPDGTTTDTSATGIGAIADANVADTADGIYALDNYPAMNTQSILIGAVGPGEDGNNTAVTVQTFSSACDWFNAYDNYSSAVDAATDITNHPIASKVFKINVYRKSDLEDWNTLDFSAISASPVETFYGTRTAMQDSNKRQLYISEVVNGTSKYIYVVPGTTDFTSGSLSAISDVVALSGGDFVYGTNIGSTDGWSYFANREDVDVDILICPDYTTAVKQYVGNLAGTRQDCCVTVQCGELSDKTPSDVKDQEKYGYGYPSYVDGYTGWTKIYDTYNDKKVFIPNAIIGAKLMARTDRIANTWDAPAGTQNGIVGGIEQNVYFNYNQIGQLYDANINCVRKMRGVGDVMWGQKTMQLKKSAVDRINVRRLLLYIENSIEPSLIPFLFQPNTESVRLRVSNIVDSFLANVKAGGGLNDYSVVCDETNNTTIVIDNNILKVDIYVQPTKVIEFIELNIIITRTGVSITENVA